MKSSETAHKPVPQLDRARKRREYRLQIERAMQQGALETQTLEEGEVLVAQGSKILKHGAYYVAEGGRLVEQVTLQHKDGPHIRRIDLYSGGDIAFIQGLYADTDSNGEPSSTETAYSTFIATRTTTVFLIPLRLLQDQRIPLHTVARAVRIAKHFSRLNSELCRRDETAEVAAEYEFEVRVLQADLEEMRRQITQLQTNLVRERKRADTAIAAMHESVELLEEERERMTRIALGIELLEQRHRSFLQSHGFETSPGLTESIKLLLLGERPHDFDHLRMSGRAQIISDDEIEQMLRLVEETPSTDRATLAYDSPALDSRHPDSETEESTDAPERITAGFEDERVTTPVYKPAVPSLRVPQALRSGDEPSNQGFVTSVMPTMNLPETENGERSTLLPDPPPAPRIPPLRYQSIVVTTHPKKVW